MVHSSVYNNRGHNGYRSEQQAQFIETLGAAPYREIIKLHSSLLNSDKLRNIILRTVMAANVRKPLATLFPTTFNVFDCESEAYGPDRVMAWFSKHTSPRLHSELSSP